MARRQNDGTLYMGERKKRSKNKPTKKPPNLSHKTLMSSTQNSTHKKSGEGVAKSRGSCSDADSDGT